jgi:hypothetical protein
MVSGFERARGDESSIRRICKTSNKFEQVATSKVKVLASAVLVCCSSSQAVQRRMKARGLAARFQRVVMGPIEVLDYWATWFDDRGESSFAGVPQGAARICSRVKSVAQDWISTPKVQRGDSLAVMTKDCAAVIQTNGLRNSTKRIAEKKSDDCVE